MLYKELTSVVINNHTPGIFQACLWCGSHYPDLSCDCFPAHWARRAQKCSSAPASSLSASWDGPSFLHLGLLPPPRPVHTCPLQSRQSQSRHQRFLGPLEGLCERIKREKEEDGGDCFCVDL